MSTASKYAKSTNVNKQNKTKQIDNCNKEHAKGDCGEGKCDKRKCQKIHIRNNANVVESKTSQKQ